MGMSTSPGVSDSADDNLGYEYSNTGSIEEDAIALFSIIVFDKSTGSLPSASIDITSISVELARSRAGGVFSAVGITQPIFVKADGRVYNNYRMLAAEWQAGDMYRMKVSGIAVTIDGEIKYIPSAEWSNAIKELVNVESKIDGIVADIGDPSGDTLADISTKMGNMDFNLATAIKELIIDSEATITTDAGVNYFPILRFDMVNGNIDFYEENKGGGADWTNVITGLAVSKPYLISDLEFDLLNSSTAGKDFETLDGGGGTLLLIMKREVTGKLQMLGQPKTYTQGTIESTPPVDGESGNPIVDNFRVSDYVEFGIITSSALTLLELPFRFHYKRVG